MYPSRLAFLVGQLIKTFPNYLYEKIIRKNTNMHLLQTYLNNIYNSIALLPAPTLSKKMDLQYKSSSLQYSKNRTAPQKTMLFEMLICAPYSLEYYEFFLRKKNSVRNDVLISKMSVGSGYSDNQYDLLKIKNWFWLSRFNHRAIKTHFCFICLCPTHAVGIFYQKDFSVTDRTYALVFLCVIRRQTV